MHHIIGVLERVVYLLCMTCRARQKRIFYAYCSTSNPQCYAVQTY